MRARFLLPILLCVPLILLWWQHPHGPWLIHSEPLIGQRICAIGDGGWNNAHSRAVGQALVKLQCDQVRYLGDLVYPSGITGLDDPLLQSRFLDLLAPAMSANIPIYLVLGNHDWKQSSTAWLGVAQRYPQIKLPYYYYFEQWPDACAFSLETTWFEKWYYLRRQGGWLDLALDRAQQQRCRFSLVFTHHPLVSTGSHGDAGAIMALTLKERLQGRTDLIISGHDHILSDEGEYQGTRQLISGAVSTLSDLGPPSTKQRFTRASHGLATIELAEDQQGLYADYRFYSVMGDPTDPLITLLWQDKQRGRGVR